MGESAFLRPRAASSLRRTVFPVEDSIGLLFVSSAMWMCRTCSDSLWRKFLAAYCFLWRGRSWRPRLTPASREPCPPASWPSQTWEPRRHSLVFRYHLCRELSICVKSQGIRTFSGAPRGNRPRRAARPPMCVRILLRVSRSGRPVFIQTDNSPQHNMNCHYRRECRENDGIGLHDMKDGSGFKSSRGSSRDSGK